MMVDELDEYFQRYDSACLIPNEQKPLLFENLWLALFLEPIPEQIVPFDYLFRKEHVDCLPADLLHSVAHNFEEYFVCVENLAHRQWVTIHYL